ncbi:MAG: type II secretion system F family protein, partial [Acidimicrobiales bacterium]
PWFGPQTFSAPLTEFAQTKGARNLGIAMVASVLLIAGLLISFPPSAVVNMAQSGRDRAVAGASVADLTGRLEDAADKALNNKGRARRLSSALERAGIELRPGEFIVIAGAASIALALIASLLVGPIGGLLVALLCFFGFRQVVSAMAARRSKAFVDQLPATLQLIAGALRAGYALPQAAETVASEMPAPTSDEFHRLVTEHRLGRDFSESLHAMADRVRAEDFMWVVQAIDIHREVGGDLAEVLDNVNATMRDRNFIRRQFAAVSAEGRYSAYLIVSLPFFVILALSFTNPDYISLLFTDVRGLAALFVAVGLIIVGSLIMRQMVKVRF